MWGDDIFGNPFRIMQDTLFFFRQLLSLKKLAPWTHSLYRDIAGPGWENKGFWTGRFVAISSHLLIVSQHATEICMEHKCAQQRE